MPNEEVNYESGWNGEKPCAGAASALVCDDGLPCGDALVERSDGGGDASSSHRPRIHGHSSFPYWQVAGRGLGTEAENETGR